MDNGHLTQAVSEAFKLFDNKLLDMNSNEMVSIAFSALMLHECADHECMTGKLKKFFLSHQIVNEKDADLEAAVFIRTIISRLAQPYDELEKKARRDREWRELLEESKQRVSNFEKKCQQLKDDKRKLENELEALRGLYHSTKGQVVAETQSQINALEAELASTTDALRLSVEECAALKSTVDQLPRAEEIQAENTKLRKELAEAERAWEVAERLAVDLDQRVRVAEQRPDHSAELKRLSEALAEAQAHVAGLMRESQAAEATVQSMSRELAQAKQDAEAARSEALSLRQDLDQARLRDATRLIEELESYRQSISNLVARMAPTPAPTMPEPAQPEQKFLDLSGVLEARSALRQEVESRLLGAHNALEEYEQEAGLTSDGSEKDIIARHVKQLTDYKAQLMAINQTLKKESLELTRYQGAMQVVQAGPPPCADEPLPAVPELVTEVEPPIGLARLEGIAAKHNLTPIGVLVATLYEIIPNDPKQADVRRVMACADQAGILTRYGVEKVRILNLEWLGTDKRRSLNFYVKLRESRTKGSMIYYRSNCRLPWSEDEILTVDEQLAFERAFATPVDPAPNPR